MRVAWMTVLCFFSYMHSQIPLFTHNEIAKISQGRKIACSDTQQFNTANLPQQCIKVYGPSKQFPRYLFPISRKGHYIKTMSDKNVSEFIVRKEDCPEQLKKQLTCEEQKAFGNNKIVRFYRKNPLTKTWSAIATIPEQEAHKVISQAFVYPDGSINL